MPVSVDLTVEQLKQKYEISAFEIPKIIYEIHSVPIQVRRFYSVFRWFAHSRSIRLGKLKFVQEEYIQDVQDEVIEDEEEVLELGDPTFSWREVQSPAVKRTKVVLVPRIEYETRWMPIQVINIMNLCNDFCKYVQNIKALNLMFFHS
jgi:hypothetical protein